MRAISPRLHGTIDHTIAALLVLAPLFVPMSIGVGALCFLFAGLEVTLAMLTSYPSGGSQLFSFKEHAAIELVLALGLVASPWLFGFSGQLAPTVVFVAFGLILAVQQALTDFRALPTLWSGPHSRWATSY